MEPFKNYLNEKAARKIARALERGDPNFDSTKFLRGIAEALKPLELKDRMLLLATRMIPLLPDDLDASFGILVKALQEDESDTTGLSGFLVWPLTQVVMERGLSDPERSLEVLRQMTEVFTAEFAVRPFLIRHPTYTLELFRQWSAHPSEHVRRLVSEGTRPLLPWGQRLPEFVRDPEITWELLEKLRDDPSEYVRKSVANHINDHSKHHGDWVVRKLRAWKKGATKTREWIIRHATRTLVKKGHVGALELHGVKPVTLQGVRLKILTPKVQIGETLRVRVSMTNPTARPTELILDHEVHFLKANGKLAPKVFKGSRIRLEAHEKRQIEFRIPLRKVTTRKHYSGKQAWALLINGKRQKLLSFELKS